MAFQTGGCLLLHESSAERSYRSFLGYFYSAISNHLSVVISMSPKWMVPLNRFNCNIIVPFRHGGLRERDQILAIDGQPLDISHQEAIKILQSAGGLVEIIVARGPLPQGPGDLSPGQETATQSVVETPEMVKIFKAIYSFTCICLVKAYMMLIIREVKNKQ